MLCFFTFHFFYSTASVFYPRPKVDAALVTIQFDQPHPELGSVDADHLRKVITASFRQRRKMLRASLRELLSTYNLNLPEKWQKLRPEHLSPLDFIYLTKDLFGTVENTNASADVEALMDPGFKKPEAVWRKTLDLYGKEQQRDGYGDTEVDNDYGDDE